MGMFDHYLPVPEPRCPRCGSALADFQGKDGPCQLLVWQQGRAAPVDQRCDDPWKLRPDALAALRLPPRFELYGDCPRCRSLVSFTGFCREGTWEVTVLGRHESDAVTCDARPVDVDRRMCSGCTEVWTHPDAEPLAGCPGCGALTRLTLA